MAGSSTGAPERRRASQGGPGPCPRQGVAARDGREFAQAQDAPSSANPGTTEKRREPRGRKARGGATGCPWGSRGAWTSKPPWSGRGSGPKRFVACDITNILQARGQRQERDV